MKVALIGEGETEYYALPTLVAKLGHTVVNVQHLGGVGDSFPWDKLFCLRIFPFVRGLAVKHSDSRPDKVVIVLDRETRNDCCGVLARQGEALLAGMLAERNLEIPIAVVLANRQIECWLMADTTLLDNSPVLRCKSLSEILGSTTDEKNVLAIIKSNLKPSIGWNKHKNGKALAQKLNVQNPSVLVRSRSLRKFVKVLTSEISGQPS